MDSEEGAWGLSLGRFLPPVLIGLSLFLGIFTLTQGWFSVDTEVRFYASDPSRPDGRGACPIIRQIPVCYAKMNTEMRPLSLDAEFKPTLLDDAIRSRDQAPSYERQAADTGSAMLGVFLLGLVGFASMLAAGGLYFWNRRGKRDHSRAIRRFVVLFSLVGVASLAYFAATVPQAAERDTRTMLIEDAAVLEDMLRSQPLPDEMLAPEISLFKTWRCCTPQTILPVEGQQVVVTIKTVSRPSIGAWFTAADIFLLGGGVLLAQRTGEFAAKTAPPAPEPAPAQATPRKTA